MQVAPEAFMAVGDGGNDLEMVANAGLGVAMGNAVPAVKQAARLVVASNDEGGVAEAIERLIL
jgi:hydroxymethylpyrimidine pyrophosphatase-like HAD family hydrolase